MLLHCGYDVQISTAVDSICFEVGFSVGHILKDNYFKRQKPSKVEGRTDTKYPSVYQWVLCAIERPNYSDHFEENEGFSMVIDTN